MLKLGLEAEKRNQEIKGSIIARLTKDNISTSMNEGSSACQAVEREKRSITNRDFAMNKFLNPYPLMLYIKSHKRVTQRTIDSARYRG